MYMSTVYLNQGVRYTATYQSTPLNRDNRFIGTDIQE